MKATLYCKKKKKKEKLKKSSKTPRNFGRYSSVEVIEFLEIAIGLQKRLVLKI